jgi:hypothetical protein
LNTINAINTAISVVTFIFDFFILFLFLIV